MVTVVRYSLCIPTIYYGHLDASAEKICHSFRTPQRHGFVEVVFEHVVAVCGMDEWWGSSDYNHCTYGMLVLMSVLNTCGVYALHRMWRAFSKRGCTNQTSTSTLSHRRRD